MGQGAPAERVVVIGASAGGVEALRTLVSGFPAELDAAVLVVLHLPPTGRSNLPHILARAGPLPAVHPDDGEVLEAGKIFVAPPDRHLLVTDGHVELARGPRENMHRPAADPLFRSAAVHYGPATIAVVLSGTRADGAAGASAVAMRGGHVVVQDPDEALYSDMPLSTIAADHPDYVIPLGQMAPTIVKLLAEPLKEVVMDDGDDALSLENRYSALDGDAISRDEAPGRRSAFACPECGGALWEFDDMEMPRFRCRVGHAYAAETLLEAQNGSLEQALWVALRALEERASLSTRVAQRLRGKGHESSATRYDRAVEEAERHASVIRSILSGRGDAAA
jgi:two-component system chemotaxis response regulator CheB